MSLKHDLKELLDNQVIDQETADRIQTYYQKNRFSVTISQVISSAAAILIGAGIVAIVAYNWDSLPKFLRTILAFVPWIASSLGCYYTLTKKAEAKSWRETFAILQFFGFAASFAMIGQIYQLQGDNFALVLMILSLPFVFIMQSTVLSAILIYFSIMVSIDTYHYSFYWPLLYIAADVIFMYMYYYKGQNTLLSRVRAYLLPWVYSFLVFFYAYELFKIKDENIAPMMLCLSSIVYIAHEWLLKKVSILTASFNQKITYIVSFIALYIALFTRRYHDEFCEILLVLLALPILVNAGYKLYRKLPIVWEEWIAIPLSALIIIFELTTESEDYTYIFRAIILIFTAFVIYDGYKKLSLLKMNVGLVSLFAWCIIVLNRLALPSFVNGLILILFGAVLFALNNYMIKKRKLQDGNTAN